MPIPTFTWKDVSSQADVGDFQRSQFLIGEQSRRAQEQIVGGLKGVRDEVFDIESTRVDRAESDYIEAQIDAGHQVNDTINALRKQANVKEVVKGVPVLHTPAELEAKFKKAGIDPTLIDAKIAETLDGTQLLIDDLAIGRESLHSDRTRQKTLDSLLKGDSNLSEKARRERASGALAGMNVGNATDPLLIQAKKNKVQQEAIAAKAAADAAIFESQLKYEETYSNTEQDIKTYGNKNGLQVFKDTFGDVDWEHNEPHEFNNLANALYEKHTRPIRGKGGEKGAYNSVRGNRGYVLKSALDLLQTQETFGLVDDLSFNYINSPKFKTALDNAIETVLHDEVIRRQTKQGITTAQRNKLNVDKNTALLLNEQLLGIDKEAVNLSNRGIQNEIGR